MTDRSDLANLRALGEPRIHEWAGASEPIGAGLVEWTRLAISHDHRLAVQAALDACALVVGDLPDQSSEGSEGPLKSPRAPREYIDRIMAAIRHWLDEPTPANREAVRASLDVGRELHAWQTDDDAAFWIREAVDHACLTVWAGERASYIIPVDFATSAGRVIACVFHALCSSGHDARAAADAMIDTVLRVTG
jgi:hypothetical protein